MTGGAMSLQDLANIGPVIGNEYRDDATHTFVARKPHPDAKPPGAFKIG